MITAHPTTYRGVRFRSRLEARWAAFFDLLEWNWLYEPIDLNGWVPDFQIRGLAPDDEGRLFGYDVCSYIHKRNPFVEVKPFEKYNQFDDLKIRRALPEGSVCIFLGYSPFFEMCEIGHSEEEWDLFSFYEDKENTEKWAKAGNIVQWRGK